MIMNFKKWQYNDLSITFYVLNCLMSTLGCILHYKMVIKFLFQVNKIQSMCQYNIGHGCPC